MREAEGEDLVEGDSAEGVPEEEGADEQAGDGLVQIAAGAAGCGGDAHADTRVDQEMWGRMEETSWPVKRETITFDCNFRIWINIGCERE